MKNFKRLMITAILAAAMIVCLSGCAIKVSYKYDNADKYIAGDREIADKIENIDIDYMEGDVTLVSGETAKVIIKETANQEIDDKLKVHTWVDGSTLHVKYCESAKGLSFDKLEKKLEITVPKDLKLGDLDIDSSAGDIKVDCSAKEFDIDSSAGDVFIAQHGESDKISIDASAGNVRVEAEKVRKLDADMSAGSGEFIFAEAPENTDIDSSAGNVTIYLPENSDVAIEPEISAGDFDYDLPLTKKGEKYICGSGANKIEIDASAGDVMIRKK